VEENIHDKVDDILNTTSDNGQHPSAEESATQQALPKGESVEESAAEQPPEKNEVSELRAEVDRLKGAAAANLEGWQRERAEFANYKRRNDAERNQLVFLTGVKIIEKLLPVIDDLDRALANLPDDLKDNGWIDGVRLTRRKLIGILESEGLSIIPVKPGDPFDPTLHDAITHEESSEFGEGQIIAEVQTGYRIGDRVLRPALVRVAR